MGLNTDYLKLLAKAMEEGKVDVSVTKVIILGTAGVGKTCVYCLLLGLPPPKKRTSTKLAKRPARVIQIISEEEGEKWEKADLKQMIAEAVPILCKRLRTQREDAESSIVKRAKGAEGKTEVPKAEVPKPKKSPFDRAIKRIVFELNELATKYQKKRETQQLAIEKKAIYLTDSGGQQAFWDLVPIFLRGPSTILFVNRLCDELGKKPLNDWYNKGKIVGCSKRATLITAEVFKLLCQRIESGGKSKVIVIGTHKDVYEAMEEPKETIEDKNTKFDHCIPKDSKIYFNEALAKVIFEVNTAKPKKEDKDIAKELRKAISHSAQINETMDKKAWPIPIAWYVLQIVLEEVAKRLKRQVLSISECETVAKELSFEPDEMKAALKFFDILNIFFYNEAIVPNVVFISSQVPLNCVTELVKKRYQLLEAKENPSEVCKPTDGMWLQFRDQARIKLEHLQDEIFKPHYVPGVFTEEQFLHMLKELLIVAPINKPLEDLCFFPSLLEMVEVDGFLKKDDIVARVIHFPDGYAPPGVFCCTVCHLQSKSGWKIRDKDIVARNQVTFAVEGSKVTFVDKFQFFAVAIERRDVDQGFCTNINSVLYEAIEHALETTHKKETLFGLSFFCRCSNHKAPHPATVGRNFRLICTKEGLKCGTLDDQQKMWQNLPCLGICHTKLMLNCDSFI